MLGKLRNINWGEEEFNNVCLFWRREEVIEGILRVLLLVFVFFKFLGWERIDVRIFGVCFFRVMGSLNYLF